MIFIIGKVGDPKHFPNKTQTFPEQNPYIVFLAKTLGFKNPYFYRTKPINKPYETIRNVWVFWLPGLYPFIALLLSFLGSANMTQIPKSEIRMQEKLRLLIVYFFVNCLWRKVFQSQKPEIDPPNILTACAIEDCFCDYSILLKVSKTLYYIGPGFYPWGKDKMSLRINPVGTVQSSRQWSCSTLHDGAEQLIEEAKKVEDEELELMKLIED